MVKFGSTVTVSVTAPDEPAGVDPLAVSVTVKSIAAEVVPGPGFDVMAVLEHA